MKSGQKTDLNVCLLQDNLDSVNVMANANTASNPLIGVTENKLIDDKQHIDSFAFVTVKTEVKVSYRLLICFHNFCICYHYSRKPVAKSVFIYDSSI